MRSAFTLVFAAMATLVMTAFSGNVNAATFVVNTTADTQDAAPGNGACADAGGMCSLRAAITEANALAGADVITLPAGTYTETLAGTNEDANANGDFDITSPLTINGAGAATTIVQANAAAQTANERVFHVLAGGTAVIITGITIQNGVNRFATAPGGGGIRVEGSTAVFTLSDATVTNNLSEGRGGGITTNKANLTITNSTFTNNASGSAVAASTSAGGAIAVDSEDNVAVAGQTATISNTTITGNKAESAVNNAFGGGVSVRALNSTVTVTGCTISNNLSNATNTAFSGFAGGLHNQQAHMIVMNSTVNGNTSSHFHAGIRNLASTAAAATLDVVNTTISNNTSAADDAQGGGVTNIVGSTFTATLNVDRSTISGNNLAGTTSVGGGVINVGTTSGAALTNITNSTISGNSAHDAAGIYSDGPAATCRVNFSTVTSNTAVEQGGGLLQDSTPGGMSIISNSIFADNVGPAGGADLAGTPTSSDYNQYEVAAASFVPAAHDVQGDPGMGALGNNGGPTQTQIPGAVVRDTIPIGTNSCGNPINNDQRGSTRPAGAGCDKGSVEVGGGTPTPTSTPTSTPTGTPLPAISGVVTYGNAIGAPTPRPVSNVTISGAGSPYVTTTTAFPDGTYSLSGFGAGPYTITPSKTTGVNNITSFDAARIAQHVAGVNPLTGNALVVADVSNNGTISSFDAAEVASYVVSTPPFGSTGTWRFSPVNRTYGSVTSNITGQDYSALLMGEVSGNWSNTGARSGHGSGRMKTSTAVTAPRLLTPADKEVVIPVGVQGTADKGIISYEFDLRYDPSVIQPQANPADLGGTLSSKLSVAANGEEAGLLRVAVYGPMPFSGDGILLNLRFTAVGASGSVSPLTWERFMLNEDATTATDGQVELSAAAQSEAEISGRVLNAMGEGVPNARVTLTDTTGQARSLLSNGFGFYRFGGLQHGQSYTISIESKRYNFTPLTISVADELVNVDMIAAR